MISPAAADTGATSAEDAIFSAIQAGPSSDGDPAIPFEKYSPEQLARALAALAASHATSTHIPVSLAGVAGRGPVIVAAASTPAARTTTTPTGVTGPVIAAASTPAARTTPTPTGVADPVTVAAASTPAARTTATSSAAISGKRSRPRSLAPTRTTTAGPVTSTLTSSATPTEPRALVLTRTAGPVTSTPAASTTPTVEAVAPSAANGQDAGNGIVSASVDSELPDDATFLATMTEILEQYGPKQVGNKTKDAESRAIWIRDLVSWQIRIMSVDFEKSEASCRRMIVPGTGSVDLRKPSEANQWREWRVATKQELPRQPGQTKSEHNQLVYARWNSFKPDPAQTIEENAAKKAEKDADVKAMNAWKSRKIETLNRSHAATAMANLNEKLAALATVANDLHGICLVALAAHPNGRVLPTYTGPYHARAVFKSALTSIKDGRYDMDSVAHAFWHSVVARPPPAFLRPGARLVTLANSLAFITKDDVEDDTDQTWAVVHGVIYDHLFRIADDAIARLSDDTALSPEQMEAEEDWIKMSKTRTRLPCKDFFTVLSRMALKVTGWPSIARSLLSDNVVVERDEAEQPLAIEPEPAVSTSTPTSVQHLAAGRGQNKKGRKKKTQSINAMKTPSFSMTVKSGTLLYFNVWPREDARRFLFMLQARHDLVKVVPIAARSAASATSSTATLESTTLSDEQTAPTDMQPSRVANIESASTLSVRTAQKRKRVRATSITSESDSQADADEFADAYFSDEADGIDRPARSRRVTATRLGSLPSWTRVRRDDTDDCDNTSGEEAESPLTAAQISERQLREDAYRAARVASRRTAAEGPSRAIPGSSRSILLARALGERSAEDQEAASQSTAVVGERDQAMDLVGGLIEAVTSEN